VTRLGHTNFWATRLGHTNFSYWAIVYFGQFIENYRFSPNFWATFSKENINVDRTWIGLYFGRFSDKLIWSPWPWKRGLDLKLP
jgi:hypothetical protein